MSEQAKAVRLPAYFGAEPAQDVFFHVYGNEGRAVRSQVSLTHHLLSFLQEGRKEVVVADRREAVDAGRVLLLTTTPSIMSEHSLHGRPMRSVLLFVSSAFLLDFSARSGTKAGAAGTPLLSVPHDASTRHFARSIELLGPSMLADAALRRAKAEEALLYLRATHPAALSAFLGAALGDRADLSLRYVVARHQDGNLTLPELAFLCGMGLSTFKRRFQDVFGMSPGRYLHARRMERAKALLERRRRPSDIYLELGYESLSAFSTEFKKHFGFAPGRSSAGTGPSA